MTLSIPSSAAIARDGYTAPRGRCGMRAKALCKGRMIPRLFSLRDGCGSTWCRGLVRISNGRVEGAERGKRDLSQKRLGMTWLVGGARAGQINRDDVVGERTVLGQLILGST